MRVALCFASFAALYCAAADFAGNNGGLRTAATVTMAPDLPLVAIPTTSQIVDILFTLHIAD